MSTTLIIAMAILLAASIGFVIVGSAYKWNVASPGYGRWTRAIGVVAVLGLAGVTAWDRIEDPVVAAVIAIAGIALAVGFALVHKRLADKVRDALS